jgi:quinol-cytochrome oxidoreductase complex cytochrome b subunit
MKKEKPPLLKRIKPEKLNWRHYFGGAALVLFLVQLLTGLYMMFYYEPGLTDTYKSIQYLTNATLLGSFLRNTHRYAAFLMVFIAFFHMVRSFYRADYIGRRVNWITGVALFLLVLGFTVTGAILPWEWKGYWIMEMFVNFVQTFPLIGLKLRYFFMDTYTPMRNFILHDIFFPIAALILLEYHCLSKLKKRRGITEYLLSHFFITLPILAVALALVVLYPIPTQDPVILPMPLDGRFIPAPEWFFVTFLIPFWKFHKYTVPIFTFYIPLGFVTLLIGLPFLHRKNFSKTPKFSIAKLLFYGPSTAVILFLFLGTIYGSHDSPWAGCNCCHNISMGQRMGIPPVTFKDRTRNPLNENRKWMMLHWYEPQVTW